jgi:hypothetical protein
MERDQSDDEQLPLDETDRAVIDILTVVMWALFYALVLAGCAGTRVEFSGELCGQPVTFSMYDQKDRTAADIAVRCGEDGGVTISTTESGVNQAIIDAQANAIQRLADEVGRRVPAVP